VSEKERVCDTYSWSNTGSRCAAQMIVSMWTIEVTVLPSSSNVSGSTTHMPVLSFGESPTCENQHTRAQGYWMPSWENEKKNHTQATSRLHMPSANGSMLRKTVS